MKGMKYYALCIINFALLMLLSGCIEEFEADIPAKDTGLLVVEGRICSSEMNKFTLSRTQAMNSQDLPRMITGATVSVRGSDGSEYKAQYAGGYYTCQIGPLEPDVEYYLHIETDGEVYESDPQKPLPTEGITNVIGVQSTPESSIDILITPDAPFEPDQANYYQWSYDETWEVRPEYRTDIYYDTDSLKPIRKTKQFPLRGWLDAQGTVITVGSSTGYDDQHIQRLKVYDIDRGDERVYYKYSGLVHQRAISKSEYEYELARRQASSEMGGLFTPLPSALPTNIHCLTSDKHVIGYIGCSLNESQHRFILKGTEYSIRYPTGGDTRVWLIDPSVSDCLEMVAKGMYLCQWDPPDWYEDHKVHSAWAYIHQLDIRYKYKGAYIEAPDYWDEEY